MTFTDTNSSVMTPSKQARIEQHPENLPQEIIVQRRFFAVDADKVPKIKGWSNPDNQTLFYEVEGLAGFDTSGHGVADDYILFDFDHVLNERGEFVSVEAEAWFNLIQKKFGGYCERSISGRGLHVFGKPSPNKFSAISNGKNGVLHFDRANDVKLELFYKTKGRYCLMTGNLFDCEAQAPIASGEVVDSMFQTILAEIQKRLQAEKTKPNADTTARKPQNKFQSTNADLGNSYDLWRAEQMLDCIDPSRLEDSEWFAVISACKNIGIDYPAVDTWNRRDPDRYNEEENQTRWDSQNDPSYSVSTLHGIAKQFGYSEKDARREWYQLHPEIDKFNTDRLQSARKTNTHKDAEPIGISDSNSQSALRQERADCMQDLMTTREVADFVGVAVSTVKNWRQRKLFGCYFFPADEKHGDTLYYYRERVEQLKAVYQKGILQRMYKLAKRNPDSEPPIVFSEIGFNNMTSNSFSEIQSNNMTSNSFQKSDSSDEQTQKRKLRKLEGVLEVDEDEYRRLAEAEDENYARRYFKYYKDYFSVEEVADYFGVKENTVIQWVKREQLKWDLLDHNGEMFFKAEHVFEFTPPAQKKTPTDRADLHPIDLSETRKDDKETVDLYAKIRQQCRWSRDKNGNPTKIKSDVFNYKLVFEQDPNLRGLFGRDNFRQEIVFLKKAQWHDKNLQLKDTWDDTDDAELRLYLAEHYAEMGTPQRTLDFVIRVARENSFHAVRNFFENLPQWDNEERAETIFIKFLGAEDSRYTREITMHFLFGAIARALYPGCDFQSVIVIQGEQGIGKSRLLRMLGGKHGVNPTGDSWHIALRDQLDDSHAVDAMRKGWLVEVEEFAAASRADVNSMKGVLSADDVTRRFAYERHAKTIKAHWVFAATCNDDAPLRDQTGNRRFLPIKCNHKESTIVEGMTPEYIRLVWAEAYHKFKQLFPTVEDFDADKLRLSPDLQAQAAKFAECITQDDGLASEIKGFLDRKIPPLAIWYLLTKEERRKFFVEGSITLLDCVADLNKRARAKYGRNAQSYIDDLDRILNSNEIVIRKVTIKRGDDSLDEYHIYGTEERQHICAAEIFNECFGQDNRKRMPRINETLARLDGWHAGERLRNIDPAYPDQKKPYYRS